MSEKVSDSREFIRGAARTSDLIYMITRGKALAEEGTAHASVIGIYEGNWVDGANVDWDSTAIANAKYPSARIVLIGEDGDVCTYAAGKPTKEVIEPEPKMIRNAATIDGYVVACGMRRQVYKRVDEDRWLDISAPFSEASDEVGFEAIAGFSSDEIYAVGWNGEIWEYDGSAWADRGSLTNITLTSVCCAEDGRVYVAGQQGTLLTGRHNKWEVIEWDEETDDDLWGLCWFDDKLYVATMKNLFTLDGNLLVAVDFGDVKVSSCYSLSTAEGVLWSVGNEDVLSFDGSDWQKYE